jgi:hypothetical protein
MSVTEIIEAVKKLPPADRVKVAEALRRTETSNGERTISERQDELHRRLIEEGLLKRIPDRSLRDRNFKPIKIKGKPLSETIIEERR